MVLARPYESRSTIERREKAAQSTLDRNAGIDVNVSNLTIASQVQGADLRISRIARDAGDREAAHRNARRVRRRQRALERSRRAANREQYDLSARQHARASKRAA